MQVTRTKPTFQNSKTKTENMKKLKHMIPNNRNSKIPERQSNEGKQSNGRLRRKGEAGKLNAVKKTFQQSSENMSDLKLLIKRK